MQEPYNWYILYVRSNTEAKAVDTLKKAFCGEESYSFDAFCPESEQYYRCGQARQLGKIYRKRPLFPGYVFAETDMPTEQFRKEIFDVINKSAEIIRILDYGSRDSIALKAQERERLEYLLKGKRCLEHSIGYIQGDNIVITGGPLIGLEGSIAKINRHNRTAEVVIELFGQKQTVKLALEIVSKN